MSPGFCLLLFSRSTVSNSATLLTATHQASLSFSISQSFCKLISIESMMPCNQLIFCLPLLFLPSLFPSIRVFFRVCSLNQMAEVNWSFSISPSNEYSGLISFTIAWFDLLAVQGDSQESSPAPQFESINSLVLSLLYGSTLTSIHDYWKNHSFE